MTEEKQPTGDWATQLVDDLEGFVDTLTSKTTQPIRNVARALVYGLLVAGLGVAILLLLTIGAVRGLTNLLGGRAWAADAVLGGIFSLSGMLLWRKRHLPK